MTEPERQCIRRRTAELIRQFQPDVAGRIEVVTALMQEFGLSANSALGWWQATKGRMERMGTMIAREPRPYNSQWQILSRHRWVQRCTITESIHRQTGRRRFSATIDGWQNWRLLVVEKTSPAIAQKVIEMVRAILARIDAGDEEVFEQSNQAW